MITLITGAPGSGKSAALVSLLSELEKNRTIYVSGIPDLAVPHIDLDKLAAETYAEDDPLRVAYKLQSGNKDPSGPNFWPELVPDGSLIVVDECQRVWRPRGPGSKVPLDISAMETHRHRGLDFYIITQAPRLVDSNIRGLVGRHVHLRDIGILGRWWYEWPECAESCGASWKNAPIKKRYRLDKAVFSKYKSASVHIKPIRSLPWMLVVLIVALLLTAFLGYKVYRIVTLKSGPAPDVHQPGASGLDALKGRPSGPPGLQSVPYDITSFTPRVSSRPESAPAYDGLRVVVAMPKVTAGYCAGEDECKCYTDQGTDAGLSVSECRRFVTNPPFDPYRVKRVDQSPSSGHTAQSESGPGSRPSPS